MAIINNNTKLFVVPCVLILISCCCNAQTSNDRFVTLHNNARSVLGVGMSGLVWNTTLANYASWWANQQATEQKNCSLVHSYGPYGENLWWGSWFNATPDSAVNWWVAEKQYYSYATNTCATGKKCGHYTQIVWSTTKRVGCASVSCKGTRTGTFTVCSYDPPGNYIGLKPY